MVEDPHEQRSLTGEPAWAEVQVRLLVQLADWLAGQARGLESRGGEALPGEAWKRTIHNRYR